MRDVYLKAKEILGKKPIKKGEVIMSAEPFAYVIDAHQAGGYCENCLISSSVKNLKPCKLCGVVWYCSKNCEAVGCQLHNYECHALKRLNPYVPPSFARLLVRIINKLKDGGDQIAEAYGEFKNRKFKHLMNHYSDIRKDDTRMKDVRSIRQIMISMIGEKNLPPESDFIGLYGRVLVNRFCLMDNRMAPIGSALYIKASIFDHSCEPNAYATFVGKNVEIRSLVDWPELDYDKVFISYLDLLNGTPHRRMELWCNWYFWCQCSLCTHTERIQYENCINCENPDCQILVPVPEKPLSPFSQDSQGVPQCPSCGTLVKRETLEEYQSSVAYTRQRLKALKETSTSMDLCLNVLEKQKNLFPPRNLWRVKALDSFFNAAYYNGIFSVALKWGSNNIDGMRYYYGPDHPTLGMFMMKLGKSLLYLKLFKEGNDMVKDADRILSMALGPRHHLVAEDIGGLKVMATEDPSILLDRVEADREQKEHESVCTHCGRRKNKLNHEENGEISHNGHGTLITNGEISEETLKREFPSNKNPPKRINNGLKIKNEIANGRKGMKTTTNKRTPPKIIRKRSKRVLDYSLLFGDSSDEEEAVEDLTEEEVNARIAKILTKYSSSDGQWIWERSKTISKNQVSNGYINDKKSNDSFTKTGGKEEKEVAYPSRKSTESKKKINGESSHMSNLNFSKLNGHKSQGNSNLCIEPTQINGKDFAKNLQTSTNQISLDEVNDTKSRLSCKEETLDVKVKESKEIMKRESISQTSKNNGEEPLKPSLISELPTESYYQVSLDSSCSNPKVLNNSVVDKKLSQVNGTIERENSKSDSHSSFTSDQNGNSAFEYTPKEETIKNKTLSKKKGGSMDLMRRKSDAGTSKNNAAEESLKTSIIRELQADPYSQAPPENSFTNPNVLNNSSGDYKLSNVNGRVEREYSKLDSRPSFTSKQNGNPTREPTPNNQTITNEELKTTCLTISDEETNLSSSILTNGHLNSEAKRIDPSTQPVHDGRVKIKTESLANGVGEKSSERINLKNKTASQELDTFVTDVKGKTEGQKKLLDYSLIYGNSSDECDDSDSEVSMTEDEVYIRLSIILSKYSLPNGKMIWDEPKAIPPKVSNDKSMITSEDENKSKSKTSGIEEKLKNDLSSSQAVKISDPEIPFKCSNNKSINNYQIEKVLIRDSKLKKTNNKLDEKKPSTSYESTSATGKKTSDESTNVEVEKCKIGLEANDTSDDKPEEPKLRMFDTTGGNRVIVRY